MENNWKKILFLDIDGVVNSDDWYNKTRGRSGDFDPEAIALLNQLKDIGVEVVISSSWGQDGVKPLEDVGLELPIVGCTEHFYTDWLCLSVAWLPSMAGMRLPGDHTTRNTTTRMETTSLSSSMMIAISCSARKTTSSI